MRHGSYLVWLLSMAGVATGLPPGTAKAQCSIGTQVADTCGDISYEGCCSPDQTLQWCENSVLCAIACAQNPDPTGQKCGWSDTAGFYDCGQYAVVEPTCTHPYDCPGSCVPCGSIGYEGCCDGLVVTWCECGCLRTIDCSLNAAPNNTCGWKADVGYYDCGAVGAEPTGTFPLECSGGPCVPSCGGRQCGDDGCGGSCGTCPAGYVCNASGLCEVGTCVPSCAGKQCGSDGCGGTCGTCPADQTCVDGACTGGGGCGADPSATCLNACGGAGSGDCWCDDSCKDFGDCCPDYTACCGGGGATYPDACLGLSTPSAPTCPAGLAFAGCCDASGRAVWCDGGQLYCLDCAGNGYTCGWSADSGFYDCDQVGPDPSGQYPISCDGSCTPSCAGKQCGSDGCGGTCGTCPGGQTCTSGQCVGCTPSCAGKQCGSDGCGGTCGTCPAAQVCNASGQCVASCTPSCAGKQCGDDGCGGSCGSCEHGFLCQSNVCVEIKPCVPDCSGKECGPDGCDGSCGVCQPPRECSAEGHCYDPTVCTPACAGKQCGSDGCGGSCGTCPAGSICSLQGRCEAISPPDGARDAAAGTDSAPYPDSGSSETTGGCPPGYVSYYGKCQPQSPSSDGTTGAKAGGGCAAGPASDPGLAWLLALLAAGVLRSIRRRPLSR